MKKRLAPIDVARVVGRSSRWVNNLADAGLIRCERDVHGRRLYSPEVIAMIERHLGLRMRSGSSVSNDN
jgi:DNA-binding transcriptional MerR regulator